MSRRNIQCGDRSSGESAALKSCRTCSDSKASYQSRERGAPASASTLSLKGGSRSPHWRRFRAARCAAPIMVSRRSPISPTNRNSSIRATVSSMAAKRSATGRLSSSRVLEISTKRSWLVTSLSRISGALSQEGSEQERPDAKLEDLPAIRQQGLVLWTVGRILLRCEDEAKAFGLPLVRDIAARVVELACPEIEARDPSEQQGAGIDEAVRLGVPSKPEQRLESYREMDDGGAVADAVSLLLGRVPRL